MCPSAISSGSFLKNKPGTLSVPLLHSQLNHPPCPQMIQLGPGHSHHWETPSPQSSHPRWSEEPSELSSRYCTQHKGCISRSRFQRLCLRGSSPLPGLRRRREGYSPLQGRSWVKMEELLTALWTPTILHVYGRAFAAPRCQAACPRSERWALEFPSLAEQQVLWAYRHIRAVGRQLSVSLSADRREGFALGDKKPSLRSQGSSLVAERLPALCRHTLCTCEMVRRSRSEQRARAVFLRSVN